MMTGDELRQARRARNLSRRALAALAGLHSDSVRYWEHKPRVDLRGYLGKAEPKHITLHGKRKDNPDKIEWRWGGEGPIEGKRFGISRAIHRDQQNDANFIAPHIKP